MVALDEKTYKIWKKLPDQKRSETIRAFLHDLEDKPLDEELKKGDIKKLLLASQDNQPGEEKTSEGHAMNLSRAARTVQKRKKHNFTGSRVDIRRLFKQATG